MRDELTLETFSCFELYEKNGGGCGLQQCCDIFVIHIVAIRQGKYFFYSKKAILDA